MLPINSRPEPAAGRLRRRLSRVALRQAQECLRVTEFVERCVFLGLICELKVRAEFPSSASGQARQRSRTSRHARHNDTGPDAKLRVAGGKGDRQHKRARGRPGSGGTGQLPLLQPSHDRPAVGQRNLDGPLHRDRVAACPASPARRSRPTPALSAARISPARLPIILSLSKGKEVNYYLEADGVEDDSFVRRLEAVEGV